ncbi:MAG: hypothetical protein RLZZ301_1371 [Bacteroidota bacterium]|jgi:hypothetical protein
MEIRFACLSFLLFTGSLYAQTEQEFVQAPVVEQLLECSEQNLHAISDLKLLSPIQLQELQSYLEQVGTIHSLYELQGLTTFTLQDIALLVPYLAVPEAWQFQLATFSSFQKQAKKEYLIRMLPSFYPDSTFLGPPLGFYQRFILQIPQQLALSISAENDVGEAITFRKNQRGFDAYSLSLFLKRHANAPSFYFGDFQFQSGQGLQLWSSLGMGRSIDLLQSIRVAPGLKPNRSADEQHFLRGAALDWQFHSWKVSALASIKKIDAHLDTNSSEATISSIDLAGYHRTQSELQRKNQVTESIFALALSRKMGPLQTQILLCEQQLDAPLKKIPTWYNTYDFQGKSLSSLGFSFSGTIRQTYLYGEAVTSYWKSDSHSFPGTAFVVGLLRFLDPRLQLNIHVRSYSRAYAAFYSNGFAAHRPLHNEQALFFTLRYQFHQRLSLSTALDAYQFPWLSYGLAAPSQALFFQLQLTLAPTKHDFIRLQLQSTHAKIPFYGNALATIQSANQSQLRVEFHHEQPLLFSIGMRNELSWNQTPLVKPQFAFLSSVQVAYHFVCAPLQLEYRCLLTYNSGEQLLYFLEPALSAGSHTLAIHGNAIRSFLQLHYKYSKNATLSIKIGSSYSAAHYLAGITIEASQRYDCLVQWKYNF